MLALCKYIFIIFLYQSTMMVCIQRATMSIAIEIILCLQKVNTEQTAQSKGDKVMVDG